VEAHGVEVIPLALEGEALDVGIGHDVNLAELDHVMALAERHGFGLADPRRTAAEAPMYAGVS
jgi:hypothetical protein